MTYNDKLKIVGKTLAESSSRIYHYYRPESVKAPYGVWQEDSEDGSAHSNNHKSEQQIHGTLDWYTLKEYDTVIDTIQEHLDAQESISYRVNSVQYEDTTKLIHTEFEWWVN